MVRLGQAKSMSKFRSGGLLNVVTWALLEKIRCGAVMCGGRCAGRFLFSLFGLQSHNIYLGWFFVSLRVLMYFVNLWF